MLPTPSLQCLHPLRVVAPGEEVLDAPEHRTGAEDSLRPPSSRKCPALRSKAPRWRNLSWVKINIQCDKACMVPADGSSLIQAGDPGAWCGRPWPLDLSEAGVGTRARRQGALFKRGCAMALGPPLTLFSPSSQLPGKCQSFPNGHWQLSLPPPVEVRAPVASSGTGAAAPIYNELHLRALAQTSPREADTALVQLREVGEDSCPQRPLSF